MIAEAAVTLVLWAVPSASVPAPVVHAAECPGYAPSACYIAQENTIYLPPLLVAPAKSFVLQHELGHAFDARELSDGERAAISKAMGWTRWRAEAFADFYSGCRLGLDPWVQGHIYGPFRSLRRIARRCGLIARAGVTD